MKDSVGFLFDKRAKVNVFIAPAGRKKLCSLSETNTYPASVYHFHLTSLVTISEISWPELKPCNDVIGWLVFPWITEHFIGNVESHQPALGWTGNKLRHDLRAKLFICSYANGKYGPYIWLATFCDSLFVYVWRHVLQEPHLYTWIATI